ncbi:hypothetical protein RFI_02286, partial [Reticulomyxa filosa]
TLTKTQSKRKPGQETQQLKTDKQNRKVSDAKHKRSQTVKSTQLLHGVNETNATKKAAKTPQTTNTKRSTNTEKTISSAVTAKKKTPTEKAVLQKRNSAQTAELKKNQSTKSITNKNGNNNNNNNNNNNSNKNKNQNKTPKKNGTTSPQLKKAKTEDEVETIKEKDRKAKKSTKDLYVDTTIEKSDDGDNAASVQSSPADAVIGLSPVESNYDQENEEPTPNDRKNKGFAADDSVGVKTSANEDATEAVFNIKITSPRRRLSAGDIRNEATTSNPTSTFQFSETSSSVAPEELSQSRSESNLQTLDSNDNKGKAKKKGKKQSFFQKALEIEASDASESRDIDDDRDLNLSIEDETTMSRDKTGSFKIRDNNNDDASTQGINSNNDEEKQLVRSSTLNSDVTKSNKKPIFVNPNMNLQPNELLSELLFLFGDQKHPWILENSDFSFDVLNSISNPPPSNSGDVQSSTFPDFSFVRFFFDDTCVKVFRAQALTCKHSDFLPNPRQVLFPQLLSSLPLPISEAQQKYTVQCRYRAQDFELSDAKKGQTKTFNDAKLKKQLTNDSQSNDPTNKDLAWMQEYITDFETTLVTFNYETTTQQFADQIIETVLIFHVFALI